MKTYTPIFYLKFLLDINLLRKTKTMLIAFIFVALQILAVSNVGWGQTTTETKYPTAGVDSSATGTITWSNPSYITADDANYTTATLTPSAISHYLKGRNFGFSIPTGSTIKGITVSCYRSSSGMGSIQDNVVKLIKAGAIVGSNYAQTGSTYWVNGGAGTPANWETATYGGTSDLWGTTWTAEDINNTNFGVVVSAKSIITTSTVTAWVDYIKITVSYTVSSCNAPTIDATSNLAAICSGGTVDLSSGSSGGSGCGGSWEYAWYTGDGTGSTYYNGTTWNNAENYNSSWSSVASVAPASTTTYKVKVRCSTSTSCNNTDATGTTVTVNSDPSISVDPSNQTTCIGGSSNNFAVTVTGGTTNSSSTSLSQSTSARSCTQPTVQATIGAYTNTTGTTTVTVNWTRGNGNGVLVVARLTSSSEVEPTSGTSYTASTTFSSGSTTGTGNYVVYKNTGTSVNVTGLTAGTSYTFTLYEYNTTGTCFMVPGSSSSVLTMCSSPSSLYTQYFETGTSFPTGWTASNMTVNTSINSDCSGASGGNNVVTPIGGDNPTTCTLTYNNSFSTVGYTNITAYWCARKLSASDFTPTFQWSSDGTIWNTVSFTDVVADGFWHWVNGGTRIALPTGAEGVSNLRFKWTMTGDGSTKSYRFDDFSVQGCPVTCTTNPSITTTVVPSGITTSGASSGGQTLTAGSSCTITAKGVCWNTTGTPTTSGSKTTDGTGTANFTSTLGSLSPNTTYHVRAYATNSYSTAYATEQDFCTLANVPSAPTVNGATTSSLNVTINVNSNPAATEFAIYETTTGQYVQAGGTLGGSDVWKTKATWGTVTVTGLSCSTSYTFEVKARNCINTETSYSPTTSLSTSTCTTDANSKVENPTTQITAGCVASTATSNGSAVSVFSFKIHDLGTSDGLPTKVTTVKITKSSGPTDWSTMIAGAKLYNNATGLDVTVTSATVNASDITFVIPNTNLLIANNSSSEITLKIWLETTVTDNTALVFQVPATSHGFVADGTGSTFASNFDAAVTSNTMTICVEATQLSFGSNKPPTNISNVDNFTVQVNATDANGNIDVDNSCSPLGISSNPSGIQANGTPALTEQTMASGTFEWNNVKYTTVGDFTITAHCGSLTDATSTIHCGAPPTSFSLQAPLATSGCAGNVTVSWTAATGGSITYYLFSCEGDGCTPSSSGSPISTTSTSYSFPVTAGVEYNFAVMAVNTYGTTWSAITGNYTTYSGYTWIGTKDSKWTEVSNWCGTKVPTSENDVIIPDASTTANDPTLPKGTTAAVKSITIESRGILNGNTSGGTLKVYGNWVNNGTFNPYSHTIEFNGTTDQTCDNGTSAFYHFTVSNSNTATLSLAGHNLDVNGNLTISASAGTLDANGMDINLEGNWENHAIFSPGTGTVTFDGTGNCTMTKSGPTVTVYSTGFEDTDGGTAGWNLGSVANHTEWRRQSAPGSGLSPHGGTYDCGTYRLHSTAAGHAYYWDQTDPNTNNTYIDLYKIIDATDVSSASLSFWWYYKGTVDNGYCGKLLVDGVDLTSTVGALVDKYDSWEQKSSIDISSYCSNKESVLCFRNFLVWRGAASGDPTPDGSYGFSVDDITITGTSDAETFNKVVFSKTSGGKITLSSKFNADGNVEILAGTLDAAGKRIRCEGDFINNGTFKSGLGEVVFRGASTQTIKGSANTTFYDLIKKTSADLIIGDPITENNTIEVSNEFTWDDNNDKITVGNGKKVTFKIGNELTIWTGCTVVTQNSSIFSIAKDYTDYGTYTPNDGMIKLHGADNSNILREPALVVYSQNFEAGTTGWTLGKYTESFTDRSGWVRSTGLAHNSDYDIALRDLTVKVPYDYLWNPFSGSYVDAYTDIDLSQYTCAEMQFWWRCAGESKKDYGEVIINNGTDHVLMTSMCQQPLYTISPRIDLSSYVGGTVRLIFRFYFDKKNGASPGLCIDDILITSNSTNMETFYDLTLDKSTATAKGILLCPIDINNNMLINKGNFVTNGLSFPVGQNWTNADANVTFTHMNNTITFDGNQEGKSQLINSGSLVLPFYNVVVNNTGGTSNIVSLSTNKLDVDNNLTLTAGTLDANVSGAQNIDVGGNWLNNGGLFEARTNTVTFNGASGTQAVTSRGAKYNTFGNVTINNTGSSVELQDSLTMNYTMSLVKGLLNSNNKNIRLKGHWYVGTDDTHIGTFNPGTEATRVTFFGTSDQHVNFHTDGSTYNLNNFSFNDVVIEGLHTYFHLNSQDKILSVKLLKICNGSIFEIVDKP